MTRSFPSSALTLLRASRSVVYTTLVVSLLGEVACMPHVSRAELPPACKSEAGEVLVLGQVLRPGRLEVKSKIALGDALARSGGPTQLAAYVVLDRTTCSGRRRFRFPKDREVWLEPGDIVRLDARD